MYIWIRGLYYLDCVEGDLYLGYMIDFLSDIIVEQGFHMYLESSAVIPCMDWKVGLSFPHIFAIES